MSSRMKLGVTKDAIFESVLWSLFEAKRAELIPGIVLETQGEVASGPFKGMKLILDNSSAGGIDTAAKLLGIYEQQLHPTLQAFARNTYKAIINVGCADGYYAIGLSRLFPEITSYAYDPDQTAQVVFRNASRSNAVDARVVLGDYCSSEELTRLGASHTRTLCVVDCEGFELDLLDERTIADGLQHSDLIIECHDCIRPGISRTLSDRFSRTHNVNRVFGSTRDFSSLPLLWKMSAIDRLMLTLEMRPAEISWMVCEAKDQAVN